MVPQVADDEVDTFRTDGVVCLRAVIDADWIATLQRGLERHMDMPTDRQRLWSRDDAGRTMFYDSQAWRDVDEYRDFVVNSPTAAIAGSLMGSSSVNFFFDAVFVRSPGMQFRTPYHQDEPYWSVSGYDTCSAWMPLVSVSKENALEFVRGSHQWKNRFRMHDFAQLTGDERDRVVPDDDREPFPDIDGDRASYDLVSFDMEPGDVVMFNSRTIHGGSGMLPPDRNLKVFTTKWLGDDVRVCFRPEGMDPDHTQVMTDAGLRPGDRVNGQLYPLVWSATP